MTDHPVHTDPRPEARGATRRELLAGAGVVGASALLAACGPETATGYGRESTGGGQAAPGGPPSTGSPAEGGGDTGPEGGDAAIVAVDDVPVGGGYIDAERDVVVTRPGEDEWRAFSATCTHAGCPVTSVADGMINCNCHVSSFSATDGSVLSGPAPAPLPAREITVEDGWVTLA